MIDIKLIRENKELVKENIKKKFQDEKLPLVDEVFNEDIEYRKVKTDADNLRKKRNNLSDSIGLLVREGKKEEIFNIKTQVSDINTKIVDLEQKEAELFNSIQKKMMIIPNIIDPSVPIGKDDSQNKELELFGDKTSFDFEIPYHSEIMEKLNGLDLDSARRVAGNGFYYLLGDVARLHSAVLTYARDYMIEKGFTYCIPPFMIRGDVVDDV